MSEVARLRYLRVVLIYVGLIFILGVCPLTIVRSRSGWRWQPTRLH